MFKKISLILILGLMGCPGESPVLKSEQPVVQIKRSKGIILQLSVFNQNAETIVIKDGAELNLFKDEQLLTSFKIQTIDDVHNRCQLDPLDVPPPYRYEVDHAEIRSLKPSKIVPIETQGGALNSGNALILNPDLKPLPSQLSEHLKAGDLIDFSGDITQDLRENGYVSLDSISIDVLAKVSE